MIELKNIQYVAGTITENNIAKNQDFSMTRWLSWPVWGFNPGDISRMLLSTMACLIYSSTWWPNYSLVIHYLYLCFIHPIFRFWFVALFAKKLWKYYIIFVYILQGKMGKTKENPATKETKIPETKRQKYGMNETLNFIPKLAATFSN